MTREGFEGLVREALRERDRQRRARLMDASSYTAADAAFIAKVAEAAGYKTPPEAKETAAKTTRRRRQAAAANEAAAFGDGAA